MELLGRLTIGDGPERVIVLHDWRGDHRNYDPMVPYLDTEAFTYALTDLRGYGLSRVDPDGTISARRRPTSWRSRPTSAGRGFT